MSAADISAYRKKRKKSLLHMDGSARVWVLNTFLVTAALSTYTVMVAPLETLRAPLTIPWWLMAGIFYLGEILVVHLQFKRDAYSFSLAEMALVIGLFFCSPQNLVLGQFIGSFVALGIHRRQSPLKTAFNVAHYCLEAAVAVTVFHALVTPTNALMPAGWGATFLAAGTSMFISIWMVALVISLSEGTLRLDTIPTGLTYGLAVMLTNTSLALIAVEILWAAPLAAWLLTIPTSLLFLSYRAYLAQREKRESVELLYESSRTVQRSVKTDTAAVALLSQAREMFRSEIAQMTLFSEDEENVGYRTSLGPGDELTVMERIEMDPREGVWARVAAEGTAVLVQRPIQNDRLRVYFAERGIFKDAMVAPLFGDEAVVGTVVVGDRLGEVSTFDEEDLKLFETLANHASVSLENARLVDKLKESLAHLTEMNRLKDDFVAAVSHELRTPLTSIQGYVKTLLRPEMRDFDYDQQHSFLEAVDRQSERLRNLIEDLLVVARLDAHEIQSVDTPVIPVRISERVVADLGDRLSTHDVSVDVTEELPSVESDEGKMLQILTNFVENAVKYTPQGSSVTLTAEAEGEGVTFSVTDTGNGIPADQHDKIFERFYQVDQTSTRKVGGTGLGLYLCRRLAEALDGRVWLERSDESGSTFCLWVPKSKRSKAPAPTPTPISGGVSSAGLTHHRAV